MSEAFLRVAARIRAELPEIERLVRRLAAGWEQTERSGDDLYLDGVALNLHGFYCALERIFERIAGSVDGNIPEDLPPNPTHNH